MRCQTFNAPLGAKPVMTLLGSEQATTLVVVMTAITVFAVLFANQSLQFGIDDYFAHDP